MMRNKLKFKRIAAAICLLVTVGILCILTSMTASAAGETAGLGSSLTEGTVDLGNSVIISLDGEGNGELSGALQIFLTLTLISIAPTILIMMTSFTRIIIVLHFTRAALNTQTAPPNQILIGLALILTFFVMEPTVAQINEQAIQPLQAGEIGQEEALERAIVPIREFMYPQTKLSDVQLFMDISGQTWDGQDIKDIPFSVLMPSYLLSELRIAFWIGFMIYIPFIVIDMVVASTLMGMGMMMLPPTTISMPFKILLFTLADGWTLIIGNLIATFYT